jgi:L-arabinokinase
LAELDALHVSEKSGEKRQMRERKAAAGLFNWEVLLISTKNYSYFSTTPPMTDLIGSIHLHG